MRIVQYILTGSIHRRDKTMKIEVTTDIDMELWAKNADLLSLITLRDICIEEINKLIIK